MWHRCRFRVIKCLNCLLGSYCHTHRLQIPRRSCFLKFSNKSLLECFHKNLILFNVSRSWWHSNFDIWTNQLIVSRFLVFVIFSMINIFDILNKFINILIFCMFLIITSHSFSIYFYLEHFLRLIQLYLRITNIFECLFLKISSKSLFLLIFDFELIFAFSGKFYIKLSQINNH